MDLRRKVTRVGGGGLTGALLSKAWAGVSVYSIGMGQKGTARRGCPHKKKNRIEMFIGGRQEASLALLPACRS